MSAYHNKDLWSRDEVEKKYELFNAIIAPKSMSFADWLYKDTDFALALDIGQLVQVMRRSSDNELKWHYGIVDKYDSADGYSMKFVYVRIKFADGYSFRYRMSDRPLPSQTKTGEIGDIKVSDVPADIMKLAMPNCPLDSIRDKCPLKEPMPCLS